MEVMVKLTLGKVSVVDLYMHTKDGAATLAAFTEAIRLHRSLF
jgi:hypothetical protein